MSLLELLIVVLLIAWLGGFSLVGGSLIHILLVIVVVLVIVRLLQGQKLL